MIGLWLLPTRRRIGNLVKFFTACRETGLSTPGLVLVDKDELYAPDGTLAPEYAALETPPDWRLYPVDNAVRGAAGAYRAAWPVFQTHDWVGLITDDHTPETVAWDALLVADIKGWNFVSSNDGWQAPQRSHGAIVFSVPLLQAWGWMAPPGFRHLYVDDIWETIGRATGCWSVKMDVMVRHANGSREIADETYRTANSPEFYESDERAYKKWQRDDAEGVMKRTLDLMRFRDVPLEENPDLSGLSIQIATPAGDGTYDRAYVKSLINTKTLLQACGAKYDWSELPYCSDISLARNKLVANFLRSPHTHLMMIDSDMGWDARDVVRFAAWRRDFIAGAGPKKIFPMSFCYNIWEHGKPPGVARIEADTGLVEVDEVGGAFVMVSRACIERMINGFPEMAYHGDFHRRDYALFDPLITKEGERKADDFAFCKRWRMLGGKIYLNPRTVLSHSGNYQWVGSPADGMASIAVPLAQAAE